MNALTRWLAIPLSRIPLLKYFLYPARIVIRKKAVATQQVERPLSISEKMFVAFGVAEPGVRATDTIETAWIPYRYGVLPDGSEISLGSTVDVAKDRAHSIYENALSAKQYEYYDQLSTSHEGDRKVDPVRWLAPIRTKGSDFHPLDPVPTITPLVHPPARTWRERRAMWHDYLAFKYVPMGSIKMRFTGNAGRAERRGV